MSGGLWLANPGAVLSLLDGPLGSDPGFHVVSCRFRMLRGHTANNSFVHELAGVYSLLRVVAAGTPGHGQVHLLLSSAASLGFSWDSDLCVWLRPRLPALCQISSPFQFFHCLGLRKRRLLVTFVLGLAFGATGIWTFGVL